MGQRPSYARARWLSDEEVDTLEGLDLGSLRRALGPVQKQLGAAMPGVVQGATAGSAAGPWGALVGGVAGGVLSAAKPRPGRRRAAAGPPVQTAPPVGVRPPGEPAAAPPVAAASPELPGALSPAVTPPVAAPLPVATPSAAPTAAGQLEQLLQNPALQQAIGSLASGHGGPSGTGVPIGAILNLLGTLANSAAHEAEASGAEMNDAYLRAGDGRWLSDPYSPAERAAVVWDRLFDVPAAGSDGGGEAEDDPTEWLVDTGLAAPIV